MSGRCSFQLGRGQCSYSESCSSWRQLLSPGIVLWQRSIFISECGVPGTYDDQPDCGSLSAESPGGSRESGEPLRALNRTYNETVTRGAQR
jgi:hypothetical protein